MTVSNKALSSSFSGSAKDNELADVVDTLMPSVVNVAVMVGKKGGAGSGFVYDSAKGYIITNNHVVKDATEVKIITNDERILTATVVGTDPLTDIAVLKVDSKTPLPQAKIGDSDKMRVGYNVIAIGAPFGLVGTVTTGIISAMDRNIGHGPYDSYIQTDASINPGNSGGPLFNMGGEVIGINTAIIGAGTSAGIGLSIPVNQAEWVAKKLIANGNVQWGYLGASVRKVQEDDIAKLKLAEARGVLIDSISDGSPADKGGLKKDDVVFSINGKTVNRPGSLTREVAKVTAGHLASLDVWRDGAPTTLSVTVGLRPPEPPKPSRIELPEDMPHEDMPPEGFGPRGPGLRRRRGGEPPLLVIPEELLPYLLQPRRPPGGPQPR